MAKGIVIAGTHSGCGKTIVTIGILAALKKRGLNVQSFKAGPDFIDTGLHRIVTKRPARNLDIWMCGGEYIKCCFDKYSEDADIAVIEGVMGLYDGQLSTARLAGLLNLPIILVVDAYGIAESAGAVVKGFISYDTETRIIGVIFNRVASENHFERLKNSVHNVPVLGYLPRDLNFEIPHRHLGLTVAEENPLTEENIEKLSDSVLEHIDVDRIINSVMVSPSTSQGKALSNHAHCPGLVEGHLPLDHSIRIAVAYDKAFCFYYEDNLDLLKEAGAEIIKFSPLYDSSIPVGIHAIYIGGGYPELYAKDLSQNSLMLKSIHECAESGMPIYAECGGLMYLSQGIYDFDGNFFAMAGVFPFETQMKKGRPHLGYREIILKEDCILGKSADKFRGHEFHYSDIKDRIQSEGGVFKIYSIKNNNGDYIPDEGYRYKNTLASYIHIHFGSNSNTARNFINFIKGISSRTDKVPTYAPKEC